MKIVENWKRRAKWLKHQTYALYLAYKDPRTPRYAKVCALLVVAYAFSPIDLIPDFIPVLGYLDDLILLPLGIALVLRMIPKEVITECREQAILALQTEKPVNYWAAVIIIAIWIFCAILAVVMLDRLLA